MQGTVREDEISAATVCGTPIVEINKIHRISQNLRTVPFTASCVAEVNRLVVVPAAGVEQRRVHYLLSPKDRLRSAVCNSQYVGKERSAVPTKNHLFCAWQAPQ